MLKLMSNPTLDAKHEYQQFNSKSNTLCINGNKVM